jgi:hypothetical protein
MIAMRWAVLAVATVLTLAAFGATGTDLQPSALRVAVTAIVGLLAPLFWPRPAWRRSRFDSPAITASRSRAFFRPARCSCSFCS